MVCLIQNFNYGKEQMNIYSNYIILFLMVLFNNTKKIEDESYFYTVGPY